MDFDYVLVGAGSAGCVLAERLSADPNCRVLLIETGSVDRNQFIHMPKGFAKLAYNPNLCWYFPVETNGSQSETWLRGRTLGGSSSINGSLYVRGLPSDFDSWEEKGLKGWGWSSLLQCYRELERHAAGASDYRGGSGLLDVSVPGNPRQPAIRAFLNAAVEMGLPYKEDLNAPPSGECVGLFPQTVHRGRRVSAASSFLKAARGRSNLTILTGLTTERLEFAGQRAVGAVCRTLGGDEVIYRGGEVVLCAGALNSPKLLQLSGIGPPEVLHAAGIKVRYASPRVGSNLLEHRYLRFQYRLHRKASMNHHARGLGLGLSVLRYWIGRSGTLASGAFDAGAMLKSRPDADQPDIQINMAPMSTDVSASTLRVEREPGMQMIAYPMRPLSQGSLAITSGDPTKPPRIRPNYLSCEHDRAVSVAMLAQVRRLVSQPSLRSIALAETIPGAAVNNPEQVLDLLTRAGGRFQAAGPGQHACGTCAMGTDADSVLDPLLRVNGVEGVRVMDASVMPTMVSGNTNAPVMAMAWRAAKILRD